MMGVERSEAGEPQPPGEASGYMMGAERSEAGQ
jgi:hypothetical protein